MGPQETDVLDEDAPVADPDDLSSKKQRNYFGINMGTPEARIVQPDDPDYDEQYRKKFGIEPPKKNQVYMGDGKSAILPLSSDGRVNPFEMRNKPPVLFDNPLQNLKPVDTSSDSKNQASIVDGSVKTINNNATYTGTGLNGARDRDLELFHMAHPLYAS